MLWFDKIHLMSYYEYFLLIATVLSTLKINTVLCLNYLNADF